MHEMRQKVAEYEADEEADFFKKRSAAKEVELAQLEKMRLDKAETDAARRAAEKDLYLNRKRKKEFDAMMQLEKVRH